MSRSPRSQSMQPMQVNPLPGRRSLSLAALAAWWMVAWAMLSASAQPLDNEALRRKQEDQQRARLMTRELLGNILDLQLRQLEENGLEELPVYRDIQHMRNNLQHIVETEMSQVVELLAQAQRQPATQREASFVEARKAIRTIVVRLMAERQALLRRLQMAELAEQTRRLIHLQTQVQAAVKGLTTEAQPRQEALLLQAREDQSDVKGLFLALLTTLEDVRSWGGALTTTCQDGLRILQAAQVGQHLDQADSALSAVRLDSAVTHQEAVLKGLRELLKLLEKTQGILSSEHRAVLERLQALAAQQETIRRETRQLDPSQPPPVELVQQQAEIPKALAELERLLPTHPTAEQLLEQAQAAAQAATTELFDGRPADALNDQGQVLGNLAALEELLATGSTDPASDKTAAEWAAVVDQLRSAQAKLAQAEDQHVAAVEQARQDVQGAAPREHAAADLIAEVAQLDSLPAATRSVVTDAERAARSAEEALKQAVGSATEATQERLQRAGEALDRAQAAVEASLAEAERMSAAVKIGELARAAEALERAAAEERAVAQAARSLTDPTDAPARAQALAQRQAAMQELAQDVSAGLAATVPEISQQVADAAGQVAQSRTALENVSREPQTAAEKGSQAAQAAQTAAQQLAEAARRLRDEVAETAQGLAARSAAQAQALSAARQSVEEALPDPTSRLSERLKRLQAATTKTQEALQQQLLASGKPAAAAAHALAQELAQLADQQAVVQAQAQAAANQPLASPLKTVAQQQAVVEGLARAQQAAAQHPSSPQSPLPNLLQTARDQAAQAAQALLDGQPAAAEQARQAALRALQEAAQRAAEEAQQASQAAPTAAPDLPAQRAAEAAATQAKTLAEPDAPSAASRLQQAQQATQAAATALADQQPQRAVPSQQRAEEALTSAQQMLRETLHRLAQQQAAELAQQADHAQRMAPDIGRLDTEAMLSLAAAAETARAGQAAGSLEEPQLSAEQHAAEESERLMERAAATLAAQEQRLRRDQAVAEALAATTHKQQRAAEMLERMRALAESAAHAPQLDATQALQAAEDFAEAQRATGQGAVEISGQAQVAEPKLRSALQKAAALAAQAGSQPTTSAQPASAAPESAPHAGTLAETDDDIPGTPGRAPAARDLPPDTGFIPQAPDLTARMMAGPQLTQAMQALDTSAMAATDQPAPPPANPQALTDSETATPASPAQATPAQAQSQSRANQPGGQQPSEQPNAPRGENLSPSDNPPPEPNRFTSGTRQGDADISLRNVQDAPWFAKLPPELRRAIGAGVQQKPPRAYEERLRRYFQSVD